MEPGLVLSTGLLCEPETIMSAGVLCGPYTVLPTDVFCGSGTCSVNWFSVWTRDLFCQLVYWDCFANCVDHQVTNWITTLVGCGLFYSTFLISGGRGREKSPSELEQTNKDYIDSWISSLCQANIEFLALESNVLNTAPSSVSPSV